MAGIKGNDTEYYHHDGHGNVTAVTDENGAVLKNYEYDAFGVELNEDASDGNPFRYCGAYYDKDTGLYYLINRYYDPTLGRFTQRDPAKDGANWYIYCYNNPIAFVDSNGLYAVGDEYLPYEIQLIINGNDRRTGGLTAAWNIAKANNDEGAMAQIAKTANSLRGFDVSTINRIRVMLNEESAVGAGHTATLLLNESNEGILLSFYPYPDNKIHTNPGEMRIACISGDIGWKIPDDSKPYQEISLVTSMGQNLKEKYFYNVEVPINDHMSGRNGLNVMSQKFANPGIYDLVTNNCDHQTQDIFEATGKHYDKHVKPRSSVMFTEIYHSDYQKWLQLQTIAYY